MNLADQGWPLWMFFVLWSRLLENTAPITSAQVPTHQLTNLQITVQDSKMLCTKKHMWAICEKLPKAVSFKSVHITFNIIVGTGADKVLAHNCSNFWSLNSLPMVAESDRCNGSFYTATGTTQCTTPHSLIQTLSARLLNSERFEPSELDPWYFCHMPLPLAHTTR